MPEDYVVFSLMNLMMKKSSVESWKFRCQQQSMPCRLQRKPVAQLDNARRNMLVFVVEADESVWIRMEGSQSKNHEDHIAGKGMNPSSHYNLVHKFIPTLQVMEIPDAKEAVEEE